MTEFKIFNHLSHDDIRNKLREEGFAILPVPLDLEVAWNKNVDLEKKNALLDDVTKQVIEEAETRRIADLKNSKGEELHQEWNESWSVDFEKRLEGHIARCDKLPYGREMFKKLINGECE